MNFVEGITKGLIDSILGALRYRGSQKRIRTFIRQYIIAPNVPQLHDPEIAHKCAKKIMVAVYGADTANVLSGIAWNFLEATLFREKIELLADTILLHAKNIQDFTRVIEDRDDLTHKFVEGRSDVDDFIRILLSVIGG